MDLRGVRTNFERKVRMLMLVTVCVVVYDLVQLPISKGSGCLPLVPGQTFAYITGTGSGVCHVFKLRAVVLCISFVLLAVFPFFGRSQTWEFKPWNLSTLQPEPQGVSTLIRMVRGGPRWRWPHMNSNSDSNSSKHQSD